MSRLLDHLVALRLSIALGIELPAGPMSEMALFGTLLTGEHPSTSLALPQALSTMSYLLVTARARLHLSPSDLFMVVEAHDALLFAAVSFILPLLIQRR